MAHASRASSHCSASRRFVTAPPAYFFRHDAPPLAVLWQDRSSPEGSVCPSTRSAGGVIPGFGNDNAAVRVPHQDGRTIFERDGALHSSGRARLAGALYVVAIGKVNLPARRGSAS